MDPWSPSSHLYLSDEFLQLEIEKWENEQFISFDWQEPFLFITTTLRTDMVCLPTEPLLQTAIPLSLEEPSFFIFLWHRS
ncbi:hypothetical protein [Aureibacillus halotolerans]|uniref:Uncharacterized protein n=1 Tax=Aureibacillus halotolerans TaxID=1508390 RepID=A0A4V3D5E3_9BACI|nr:hypothetical protein [Aureibacillus halotolerans]TDQ39747.1 hypothetical protein EV213_107114 [Aureibacillus halotolerans]